jgi:homogentisate 1,2-dioxygenase
MPEPRRTTSSATARATRSSSSTRARRRGDDLRRRCPPQRDYVVIPRGHDLPLPLDTPQRWLPSTRPGEIETPNRYRNRYGPAARARAVLAARLPPADAARTHRERGESPSRSACAAATRTTSRLPPVRRRGLGRLRLPVHVQHRRLRAAGRPLHLPPPATRTSRGPNFVICSFCPRMLDWDPTAVRCPTTTRTSSRRR